jgi:RluA family pseudouridine synthase
MNKILHINGAQQGQKIDLAIKELYPQLSRRSIRRMLDVGKVYVNKKTERFASRVLKKNDQIQIIDSIEKKEEKSVTTKALTREELILHEDANLVVINKPPFVISQGNDKNCAISLLRKHIKDSDKLILCHRLDSETTGCLIFAKHQSAALIIMEQFKLKKIQKTYEAICLGKPHRSEWSQKNFLSPIDKRTKMVTVVKCGGKTALSKFSLTKFSTKTNLSHIICRPTTGRSHQLRVQLSTKGLPILGDKKYFNHLQNQSSLPPTKHHLLHARDITFKTLDSISLTVVAPHPDIFTKTLKLIK